MFGNTCLVHSSEKAYHPHLENDSNSTIFLKISTGVLNIIAFFGKSIFSQYELFKIM
jgi:hypothetical protein